VYGYEIVKLGFTYIYSYKSVNIYPSIRAISRYIIKALINASICFFGFWYNSFSGIFLKRTRFVFRHHKRSTINKSKIFNPCPIILKQRKLCVKPFSLINNPNINSTNRNNRKFIEISSKNFLSSKMRPSEKPGQAHRYCKQYLDD